MRYKIDNLAKVELTAYGLQILHYYYDDIEGNPELGMPMEIGGYYKMPLYMLFDLFGDYVFGSGEEIFVNNVIEME